MIFQMDLFRIHHKPCKCVTPETTLARASDYWHPVFVGLYWMIAVMVNGQFLVVPVPYEGSGVAS
jgi:hypothetical protein